MKPVFAPKGMPVLDEKEMDLFCLLLKSGLTFPDALSLSFQSHAEIEKRLEQGIPFSQIVRSQKERNMKQLGVLMEIFDLSLALEFHEQLRKARKTLHGTLLKKSGYPLFLMAFASGLVCFFADSILPSLLGEGGSSYLSLLNLLKLVSLLFWIAVFIGVVAVGWMITFPQAASRISPLLFSIPLLKTFSSMECAVVFECVQKASLSTRQASRLIQESGCFPFAQILWQSWIREIEAGKSLEACIRRERRLEDRFIRFFEIGLETSRMEEMMQAYQQGRLLLFEKQLSQFSRYLLYAAYGFVGILAISVYQIMLEPLSMLEGI